MQFSEGLARQERERLPAFVFQFDKNAPGSMGALTFPLIIIKIMIAMVIGRG